VIAKVRIAPVERWCETVKREIPQRYRYGYNGEISILTETMGHWDKCDGRRWQLEPKSVNQLREKAGFAPTDEPRFVCEHMLEMD
jgi:hypothetical protein